MVDTRLAMQGQQLDTATPIYAAQDQQNQNAMSTEQTLKAHYENMDAREKSRLTSTVTGAAQLKAFLDKGDLEGAHEFLTRRKSSLQNRMANGENIDTEDTDYALEALRTGKVDQLKTEVDSLMTAGMIYGIAPNSNAPASIQEWQQFNAMTPADQQKYLNMKRANQTLNLGGSQAVIGPDGKPISNYVVTPKPDEMPNFIKDQEAAKLEGQGKLPDNVATQKGRENVSKTIAETRAYYAELDKKGGITNTDKGTAGNIAAYLGSTPTGQAIGKLTGTDEQSIRNKIKQKKPALINAIRAATGLTASQMNSNAELQFYLQQVGDETLDLQSNIAALDTLEAMYGLGGAPTTPPAGGTQPAPAAPQGQPGVQNIPIPAGLVPNTPAPQGKVRMVNPQTKEAFMVDPADVPAAQAEGFTQQ